VSKLDKIFGWVGWAGWLGWLDWLSVADLDILLQQKII
jgi:hypothetical protein